MKKTNRNQNMPDQNLRNERLNTGSTSNQTGLKGQKERYTNSNLDQQPLQSGKQQRYDDKTGTVENGIG